MFTPVSLLIFLLEIFILFNVGSMKRQTVYIAYGKKLTEIDNLLFTETQVSQVQQTIKVLCRLFSKSIPKIRKLVVLHILTLPFVTKASFFSCHQKNYGKDISLLVTYSKVSYRKYFIILWLETLNATEEVYGGLGALT